MHKSWPGEASVHAAEAGISVLVCQTCLQGPQLNESLSSGLQW